MATGLTITPLTSYPTDIPTHANLTGKVCQRGGAHVHVALYASAGSGTAWLLGYLPGIAKWVPYTSTTIDSSILGGVAPMLRATPGTSWPTYFAVYVTGGPTIGSCYINTNVGMG